MPPTGDSPDDHLPVLRRAMPSNEGVTRGPVMWFVGHGDLGVDGLAFIEGQTWVLQCKDLLHQADAQRLSRRSVLVFLDACQSFTSDLTWASYLRQAKSLILTDNYDTVLEPLVSANADSELGGLLAAAPDPGTRSEASTFTAALTKLVAASLRRWSDLADGVAVVDALDEFLGGELDVAADRGRLAELTHWLASADSVRPLQAVAAAQHAASEACKTRDAVVHEDPSVSRAAVARFTSTWLGLRPTPEIVEAAGAALLYAALEDFDPDDDSTTVRQLRRDTIHQNRLLKPLTSTQLCRHQIDSLDRPLCVELGDGAPITLADTVGVNDQVDELIARISGWNDRRIGKVLARLRHDELQVALIYAHQETPTTWQQAARACGLPAEFGERVRRKLHREGQSLQANQKRLDAGRSRAA